MGRLQGTRAGGLAAGIAIAAALALPSAAGAAGSTFYASPLGTPPDEACTTAEPCKLETALNNAGDGDSVRLTGSAAYTLPFAGMDIKKEIDLGGEPGLLPTLLTTNTASVEVFPESGATLHDLKLEGEGPLELESGSADRVYVSYVGGLAGAEEESACQLSPGVILRDSVCWAQEDAIASADDAIGMVVEGPGTTGTATLRNVDAIATDATGNAISGEALNGASGVLVGSGVIARAAFAADVRAGYEKSGTPPQIHIELDHSNYATISDEPSRASVTAPGTEGNQTAAPLFTEPIAGDFSELAGSPTIDAAVVDTLTTSLDILGKERVQPGCIGALAVPDIGAYEFGPATANCPPPPPKPEPPPEPPKPQFRIVSVSLHGAGGKIRVEVPAPGKLSVTGLGVKLVSRPAPTAGSIVTLPIRPWAVTKVRLDRSGKVKVRLKVIFEPTGGTPRTRTRKIVFKKS